MNPSVDTIDSVVADNATAGLPGPEAASEAPPVNLIKPKLVGYCKKDDALLGSVEKIIERGTKDCCIIPMYSKGRTLPDGTVLRTNGTYAIYADPRSNVYGQLKDMAHKLSVKRYFS